MQHKYPSIDNYYKSVSNMLGDPVVITEKLDGSNFSVIFTLNDSGEDKVEFCSRNQKANEAEGSLFYEAIEIARKSIHKFSEAIAEYAASDCKKVIFYFEVIGRGIQKRIDYISYFKDKGVQQIKDRTIVLIDVLLIDEDNKENWLVWDNIRWIAATLNVLHPPGFRKDKLNLAILDEILELKHIEGYVIRAETKESRLYDYRGNLKVVKIKTNEFLNFERKGAKNKKARPKTPPEIVEFLLDRINFGRLNSVYSHGHDTLKKEMADMKYLPDLVIEDIKGEDSSLWDNFEADVIRKTCCRMLPKVLRGYLLEESV